MLLATSLESEEVTGTSAESRGIVAAAERPGLLRTSALGSSGLVTTGAAAGRARGETGGEASSTLRVRRASRRESAAGTLRRRARLSGLGSESVVLSGTGRSSAGRLGEGRAGRASAVAAVATAVGVGALGVGTAGAGRLELTALEGSLSRSNGGDGATRNSGETTTRGTAREARTARECARGCVAAKAARSSSSASVTALSRGSALAVTGEAGTTGEATGESGRRGAARTSATKSASLRSRRRADGGSECSRERVLSEDGGSQSRDDERVLHFERV